MHNENFYDQYLHFIRNSKLECKYISQQQKKFIISSKHQLLYYSSRRSNSNHDDVFLIVPSIFNSPEILFLNKNTSFIDYLRNCGDVYLINWLEIEQSDHSLNDYVSEVIGVLIFLYNKLSVKTHVIGHCLGGNIAFAASMIQSNTVRNLTLLTTPWDFSHFRYIYDIHKLFNLDTYVKSMDTIPKIYTNILFFLSFSNSFDAKLKKYSKLTIAADRKLFFEIEHWLISGVSIPAATYFQIIDEILVNNIFANTRWIVNDICIDPQKLQLPLCIVVAKNDPLVPQNSILLLHNNLKNSKILETNGGHINYLISNKIGNFFKKYKSWLENNYA